jgi:4-alpha-glucanotransferase
MKERGSGVLCHITSLPSPYGIGDLGPGAWAFTDFLAASCQKYWQMLPLNPTDLVYQNSPYHSLSAYALNPLLISPDLLQREGLLDRRDLESIPIFSKERVEFEKVIPFKKKILSIAYERFKEKGKNQKFENFREENKPWLEDYGLFVVLKSRFRGKSWNQWPSEIKDRQPAALSNVQKDFLDEIRREIFVQFVCHSQWEELKNRCNRRGISITGDVPIYVVHDSADLWAHPELFHLDANQEPSVVAGVPPDYFSETGQLWGNPLYRWDLMKENGYAWWVERLARNMKLFDFLRIDHFRGFVAYWEIPAREKTARNGRWIEAPAMDFFNTLKRKLPSFPFVAEDLGTITPDVEDIMNHFAIPGMKVLLFAFGEDNPGHPYLPHNYKKNCWVYTGTHDNNTVRGWFENEAENKEKQRFFRYIGRTPEERNISWEFIRLGSMSAADTFIVPMQDVLGLGEEARMNRPATKKGNWRWRILPDMLVSGQAEKFAGLTQKCGRA